VTTPPLIFLSVISDWFRSDRRAEVAAAAAAADEAADTRILTEAPTPNLDRARLLTKQLLKHRLATLLTRMPSVRIRTHL